MDMQRLEEDSSLVNDVESIIRDLSTPEIQDDITNQGAKPQKGIFFGAIWWDSSWAKDQDLYNGILDDW